MCSGNLMESSDSCEGDSGGPAVVGKVLVGIVSFGYGCGRRNTPGVYTNVAKVAQWIKDQIRSNY